MNVSLEIRHLKLLTAVAEEESVTGAGKRLHLTQSALSHQLRDAEERLGTALFLRLGKRMVLTAAGKKLLECAKRVLWDLKEAETQVLGMNGEQGVIRLSTECYTCYHWLPPLLAKFHSRFPKVDVNIDMEATNNPLDALLSGCLDIAVMSDAPENKNLRLSQLCEDELVIVMAPDHSLASRRLIRPEDLARETLFIYPPRAESTLITKILQPAGVEPHRVMEIPLTEAIVGMVESGAGVALLARWSVAPQLESGRIVGRSIGNPGFRRHWYAVTLRSQPMAAYLAEFVKLLAHDSARFMRGACAGASAAAV